MKSILLKVSFGLALLSTVPAPAALSEQQKMACVKIRQYCKACHGLGDLRFIYSDRDEELWNYLIQTPSPKSHKLWAEKMAEVLSWPSEAPPPFDQPMSADGDWMPKGEKRLDLAEDESNGISSRKLIIEALRQQMESLQ